jgi:protein tyrosine/serine phosphatase
MSDSSNRRHLRLWLAGGGLARPARRRGCLGVKSSAAAILFGIVLLYRAGSAATQPPPSDLSVVQINNFGRVDSHYYRGAQPTTRDLAALASIGVKTVIDLRRQDVATEARDVRRAGMRFVSLPLSPRARPSDAVIAQFLQVASDPANQPIFVHCEAGRNRTGVVTAIYRLTQDHWSLERAFAEMEHYRFHGTHALRTYVNEYARRLTRK